MNQSARINPVSDETAHVDVAPSFDFTSFEPATEPTTVAAAVAAATAAAASSSSSSSSTTAAAAAAAPDTTALNEDPEHRVMLAYSGGLDTTAMLLWLKEKGFTVFCYCADVGQEEDFEAVRAKAELIGAAGIFIEDLRREFVVDFIHVAAQANALYENRYLLGTSLARPPIARRQVELALSHNCRWVAHGATGKGNDQVRLEYAIRALSPSVKVLAPWRDAEFLATFKGRSDLIRYCEQRKAPTTSTLAKPYSMDENLLHCSYEAGVLEDPATPAADEMWRLTLSPYAAAEQRPPEVLELSFWRGRPVRVRSALDWMHGSTHFGAALWDRVRAHYEPLAEDHLDELDAFLFLNRAARRHGIGRVDMVENRSVGGLKSRGCYETPGGTVLREAHQDIEGLCLDPAVLDLRDSLSRRFSKLIYDGLYFAPEMDIILSSIEATQENVEGTTWVVLYAGACRAVARTSPLCTYDARIASMDEEGGFDAKDSTGFININCLRLEANSRLRKAKLEAELLMGAAHRSSLPPQAYGYRRGELRVVRSKQHARQLK